MKIKETPEDFIVRERLTPPIGEGPYAYYLLKKKRWNTIDAVNALADHLGLKSSSISYAGLKDRNAITEQHISILHGEKTYESTKIKDLELKYVGNGPEKINTEQLEGNDFEITIRDIDSAEKRQVMPNYFDEQRFGKDNTNAEVGKALVQKDFRKACEILGLEAKENNFVGELQKHGKLLKLYFHSYQSRLFNRMLSEYIKKNYPYKDLSCGYDMLAFPLHDIEDSIKIPLANFDMAPEERIREIAEDLLSKEGITQRDFLIRAFPELVSQTEYRDGFTKINSLDLKKGDGSVKAIFTLQKGSYATVAIKTLFLHNL